MDGWMDILSIDQGSLTPRGMIPTVRSKYLLVKREHCKLYSSWRQSGDFPSNRTVRGGVKKPASPEDIHSQPQSGDDSKYI